MTLTNGVKAKLVLGLSVLFASLRLMAQDSSCDKRPVITSKLEDGTTVGVLVSKAQHERAPSWAPGRGEPPLSIAKVADIAQRWAKTSYKEFESVGVYSIQLSEYGGCAGEKRYWHYIVSFRPIKNGEPLFGGYFAVVLLDGTIIGPTRVKEDYYPLATRKK